jgi:hypothetical protein
MSNRRHRPRGAPAPTICDWCEEPIARSEPIVVALLGCENGCCVHEHYLHEACRDLLAAALGLEADDGEQLGDALMQRWT